MADEITVSGTLKFVNSGVTSTLTLASSTFDQTGTARVAGVQALVNAVEESITFADVAAPHWVAFKNNAPTDYVEIGIATGDYMWRLPAGAAMWMPVVPTVSAFWFLANTVPADLEYLIGDA